LFGPGSRGGEDGLLRLALLDWTDACCSACLALVVAARPDRDPTDPTRSRTDDRRRPREELMITGAHVILFTDQVEATRAFLRDALELPAVDTGGGWLIFALPPAEVAVHPQDASRHELYLMCDDLERTMARLSEAGATFGPVQDQAWGRVTSMTIPGGEVLPLYQPKHPSPTRP